MPNAAEIEVPKVFLSYCWTTPEHQAWVVKLADDLYAHRVQPIIDVYDLREGHDSHAFMERMVTDAGIKKVAMICDRAYVAKADGRKGGVGTETTIITPQIFADNQQQQNKYVAVVREHNDDGKPVLPAYFGARIYIDFVNDADYVQSLEQLVRWAYDKPVHKRPALGTLPSFLKDDAAKLGTSSFQRRAVDALKNSKPHALPALREYLDRTVAELHSLVLIGKDSAAGNDVKDEDVLRHIRDFTPYRDELIEAFVTVATYRDEPAAWQLIHHFFEGLIPYMDVPKGFSGGYSPWDFDHYRFIARELFLYTVAIAIKYECFAALTYLIHQPYLVTGSRPGTEPMVDFKVFQRETESFDYRNQQQPRRRTSPVGDLIKERAAGTAITFEELMAADFVLYLASRVSDPDEWYWNPWTLVYLSQYERRIDLFSRCYSKAFFERLKPAIGVRSAESFQAAAHAIDANTQLLPSFNISRLRIREVVDLNKIASLP